MKRLLWAVLFCATSAFASDPGLVTCFSAAPFAQEYRLPVFLGLAPSVNDEPRIRFYFSALGIRVEEDAVSLQDASARALHARDGRKIQQLAESSSYVVGVQCTHLAGPYGPVVIDGCSATVTEVCRGAPCAILGGVTEGASAVRGRR